MMNTKKQSQMMNQFTPERVKNWSERLQDQSYEAKLRQKAVIDFKNQSWPYFDRVDYQKWPLCELTDPVMVEELEPPFALSSTALAAGVTLKPWSSLTASQLEQYYTKAFPDSTWNRLLAYQVLMRQVGWVLRVPNRVQLSEPIVSEWHLGLAKVEHMLLLIGEQAQVTYFERVESSEANQLHHVVSEIFLGAGAKLHYGAIDQLGTDYAYLGRFFKVGEHAQLTLALGEFNQGMSLNQLHVALAKRGAQAQVNCVAIASDQQTQALNTAVFNEAPETKGAILQHGVILQSAHLIFNGIGKIIKGARGADAQQENRVLMLSQTARGDANPILLIDENDVRAGHAASVGRVDEHQMYYLMSRGIDRNTAERLVIRGFLGSVISQIPSRHLQQDLTEVIERKLIDGQQHRDATK